MGWLRRQHSKEVEDKLYRDFRAAFGGPQGHAVLMKILSDLYFFREDLEEEEVILQNYAKQLLGYLGVWQEGNALRIVEKLLEVKTDGSGSAT